jgi:hypothetical protein
VWFNGIRFVTSGAAIAPEDPLILTLMDWYLQVLVIENGCCWVYENFSADHLIIEQETKGTKLCAFPPGKFPARF